MTVLAFVDLKSSTLESAITRELRSLAHRAGQEMDLLDLRASRHEAPMEAGRRMLTAVSQARAQSQHLLVVGEDLHDYVQSLLLSVSEVLFLGWVGGSDDQHQIRSCLDRIKHLSGGLRDRRLVVMSESRSAIAPVPYEITENVTLLLVPCRELEPDELGGLRTALRMS